MRRLLVALSLVLASCQSSGEWADDPGNFRRAWGQQPPRDLTVLHSWYWRSGHFTREEAYFFQFNAHSEFRDGFIASNGMVARESSEVPREFPCGARPAWFLPRPPVSYRLWVPPTSGTEPPKTYLLEDKQSHDLFVYGCQL